MKITRPISACVAALLAAGTLGEVYVIRSIEASQNRMFGTGQLPVAIGPGATALTRTPIRVRTRRPRMW